MSKPCSDSRVGCEEEGEAALWLVLKESEAKKIVAAVENGHAYAVVAILKNQPWWPDLSASVRKLERLSVAGFDAVEAPVSGANPAGDTPATTGCLELSDNYGHYEDGIV